VAHAFNGRGRQISEFEARQVYTTSSRIARTTHTHTHTHDHKHTHITHIHIREGERRDERERERERILNEVS
jgi:hypothetical protein